MNAPTPEERAERAQDRTTLEAARLRRTLDALEEAKAEVERLERRLDEELAQPVRVRLTEERRVYMEACRERDEARVLARDLGWEISWATRYDADHCECWGCVMRRRWRAAFPDEPETREPPDRPPSPRVMKP